MFVRTRSCLSTRLGLKVIIAPTTNDSTKLVRGRYTEYHSIKPRMSHTLLSRRILAAGEIDCPAVSYVYNDSSSWCRCDERFNGYGGNKAACLFEMYLSGVSFYVLSDHFLIHQSHPYEEEARRSEVCAANRCATFHVDGIPDWLLFL